MSTLHICYKGFDVVVEQEIREIVGIQEYHADMYFAEYDFTRDEREMGFCLKRPLTENETIALMAKLQKVAANINMWVE